jgi:hypothetical protein
MNARGKFLYTLLLAGSIGTSAPCLAAEATETIDARITRLEQELAELKALVQNNHAPVKKNEPAASLPVSSTNGAKVQLYGFARFDGSYDTGQIYPGNIALWAWPEYGSKNDSEYNLTAGATRLGLNLSGPDTESIKLTGNIEFDFLTSLSTENNQTPRLRHGYIKAYWPASDFSILAGQSWDLFSSLIPFVDDPALMWNAGNIGSRHPQIRFTKGFSTSNNGRMEVALAASRTIGEKNSWPDPDNKGYNTDPGKDAAMPTIQGRIALSAPLLVEKQPATVALSGHYGQEEWDIDKTGTNKTLDSWSCNLELSLPICEKLTIASEYFIGSNLDDYFGGIGQGVTKTGNSAATYNVKEISSNGGWAALRYTSNPSTSFSIGAGMDNPKDNDLAIGARSRNQTIFANVINKITPNFILGLQLSEWKTEYKGASEGDAFRAQSSLTYKF